MEREWGGTGVVDRRICRLHTTESRVHSEALGGARRRDKLGGRVRQDGKIYGLFGGAEERVRVGAESEAQKWLLSGLLCAVAREGRG